MHSEVNGDEDIKLKIYKQRNIKLDLKSISEMWTVTQDDIEYKITYIKQITNGNGFHLDVRGIPLFYDKFRTSIIHYLYNGSLTAVDYFTRVFDGTGYNFVLVNPSYAEQWEGFGKGQTRMELFKKGLDRYGYEFYIVGKTIYLEHQIGNDTNFEYRYKLNASNVSKAVDASALITHIKGFGNFEEGEEDYLNNAKLKREATSPLADIVGIREPKVVVDGRITLSDTMDARLQKEIDESIYITVEATLHDVRQMGYETAVPLKGDRTFLVDERLGFDAEIRVQSVTTTKDERNRITQCDVVFGSANAGKRYKANLSTLSKNMADLLAGKIQLPFDVLEGMAKDMLLKIQSVDSELLLDNGIFAIDKANPNNILGLNSAGIYISTDGGATAQTVITADGIVANSITSGQILTHLVRVVGTEGLFSIDGDVAKWTSALDTEKYTEIRPSGMHINKGAFSLTGFDGREIFYDGVMRGGRVANIVPFHSGGYLGRDSSAEIIFNGMNWEWTGDVGYQRVHYIDDQYHGRFMDFRVAVGLANSSPVASARIKVSFTTFNGNVVGSGDFFVERDVDDMRWETVRVDLQAIYGVVPDYRTVSLYAGAEITVNTNAKALFRINRGEFIG